jgi:hypothetical protein
VRPRGTLTRKARIKAADPQKYPNIVRVGAELISGDGLARGL